MSSEPLVTIAVPAREDEARIERCLRCALDQDYGRIEVLVADGMSMDATREIVLRIASEDPRVRLIENPRRTRAAALNAILDEARGEIVVPMDPDGVYARTHVSKCVEALSAVPVDQLAIVPRVTGYTVLERALTAVQSTKLAFAEGAELARGAEPSPARLGAIRRRVFERVGRFDPGARCEEDVDLSRRITRSGGGLTVRCDIVVRRTAARSFRDLFRRHYCLGASRARRAIKERRLGPVRELGPFAILGGALALAVTVQPLTPLALVGYVLVTGAAAVRVGRREGLVTVPAAWAAFPIMHLAHGVGFGSGLVRFALRPDWATDGEERVPPSVTGRTSP